MSNEINVSGNIADQTIYVLLMNASGLFWNGTTQALEAYATANRGDYDIPLTEQGTSSGIFLGNFPAALTTAGTYQYYAYLQGGGSPDESDTLVATGRIDWTGTTSVSVVTPGSMSGLEFRNYVLRGGFKRTDKDTELYEATTDAIEELRRRFSFDEAQEDTPMTDTISVLGDFKLDVESDFGLILNVIIQDGTNATPLNHISKDEFEQRYPDINVTNDKGYPRDFTIYDGQILIGPIPDQITYTYRKSYSARGGIVTSSTTGVPFTALYRSMLKNLVLSILWEIMDQFDKAGYFKQKFEEDFLYATRRERHNQGADFFNVRPLC